MAWSIKLIAAAMLLSVSVVADAGPVGTEANPADGINLRWGVRIPLRDGVELNATLYTPRDQAAPAPCVFTLTPYISQTYHDRGVYFAGHGLPFLTMDVRGRGNSGGVFRPNIQEADDAYDVVEWLAKQPYCNGKISMWGGSYAGFDQWAAARKRPPHLMTIVPVASPHFGTDFPMQNNIIQPYVLQWNFFVAGHALQDKIFGDAAFWASMWRRRFERGEAFATLGEEIGYVPPALREILANPMKGPYYDAYNPSAAEYAAMKMPILTITGAYDGDQPGAIEHYRRFMQAAAPEDRARHYLVIGPWDHPGTRTPLIEFGGLEFGPASLVDLPKLHLDWYNWTMADGPKPDFLKKAVAYYVAGADIWRYADSLDAVTAEHRPMYLDSAANADSVVRSGMLGTAVGRGRPDQYVHDPRDISSVARDSDVTVQPITDQRAVWEEDGKQLVYHSAPFDRDTEISGFFRLAAWLSIDQPDTDFMVTVYEIGTDGSSIQLTSDSIRARYREDQRTAKLVTTAAPLRYDFNNFMFASRRIPKGHRLRLVVAPINSMFFQKNYNAAKPVNEQTMADARTVTVRLWHDRAHPSALFVPIGAQ